MATADVFVTPVTGLEGRRAIAMPAAIAATPARTANALVVLATDDPHRPSYWPRRKYRKLLAIWRVAATQRQIAGSATANPLALLKAEGARGVCRNPNLRMGFAQHCALESVTGSQLRNSACLGWAWHYLCLT